MSIVELIEYEENDERTHKADAHHPSSDERRGHGGHITTTNSTTGTGKG